MYNVCTHMYGAGVNVSRAYKCMYLYTGMEVVSMSPVQMYIFEVLPASHTMDAGSALSLHSLQQYSETCVKNHLYRRTTCL